MSAHGSALLSVQRGGKWEGRQLLVHHALAIAGLSQIPREPAFSTLPATLPHASLLGKSCPNR